MRYLPEGDHKVEHPDAAHSAAHPTRGDHGSQTLQSGLLCGIEQEIVVAPVAQPKVIRQQMKPRQESQHKADFQAQDNIKDDSQSGRHI